MPCTAKCMSQKWHHARHEDSQTSTTSQNQTRALVSCVWRSPARFFLSVMSVWRSPAWWCAFGGRPPVIYVWRSPAWCTFGGRPPVIYVWRSPAWCTFGGRPPKFCVWRSPACDLRLAVARLVCVWRSPLRLRSSGAWERFRGAGT